jgi:P-aminobenzoate N-oxygenase AurF
MSALAVGCLLEDATVDQGKRFIPEEFTPLSYTPSYRALTEEQRLRYNQLQALYFNEQIIFFETAIGRKVLEALLRDSLPPQLTKGLRQFLEEEQQHTEMFRRINQHCAPQFYGAGHFYFIQPPRSWMAALGWATQHPRFFPMFLWLMLLQEERSLFYSRRVIVQRDDLEPHFVKMHRTHLADEVGHVRWDEELIETLWQGANPVLRKVNGKLLGWMLGEFFNAPKRAQLNVVHELTREFPALRGLEPEMQRQMLGLSEDGRYQMSLYSREIVPRAFARFDEWPELQSLKLIGYCGQPEGAR